MLTRKKQIDYFVNNNIINYNLQNILELYKEELKDYKYIDNVKDFSELNLKGSIRYINIYDHKIRYGGLLIKIYNNNYIFYLDCKNNLIRNWADLFISNYNNGLYN